MLFWHPDPSLAKVGRYGKRNGASVILHSEGPPSLARVRRRKHCCEDEMMKKQMQLQKEQYEAHPPPHPDAVRPDCGTMPVKMLPSSVNFGQDYLASVGHALGSHPSQ